MEIDVKKLVDFMVEHGIDYEYYNKAATGDDTGVFVVHTILAFLAIRTGLEDALDAEYDRRFEKKKKKKKDDYYADPNKPPELGDRLRIPWEPEKPVEKNKIEYVRVPKDEEERIREEQFRETHWWMY